MPVASNLYYYTYQSEELGNPPLVLIHGAGGTHLHWPLEIRRLPGYRLFALDLPGHGRSGGRGQQSINAYALTVLGWLEALGMRRAIFIGHSMGGAIALELAIQHAEHVLGLGLLSTGARLPVHPKILENSANPTTFHQAVDMIINWAFSPETDRRLVELAAKRMAETRPSVFHGDFLACDAFDISEQITRIQQPTLVICGVEDKLTPPRYSQFLADNIPSSRLETISHAGHMVMLEQPQPVTSSLINFLTSIPYHPGETK